MPVGRAGAVDLAVESESLGGVRDLKRAGQPAVDIRVDADEIGTAVDDEVDVLLQSTDMLGHEQGRLESLPQLSMRESRYSAVFEGVLVPEVVGLVEGASHP